MFRLFNNDELGIEGVSGAAANAGKKAIKSATGQADTTVQSFVDQLYGFSTGSDEDQSGEGQPGAQNKTTAAQKANAVVRNPAAQQAANRRTQLLQKGHKPEDIDKLEKLRKMLHDEQVKNIFNPPKKQQEEEPVKEKIDREEVEKKRKKQEEEMQKQKKKEELAVVNERTKAERRPGAG